MLRQRAPGVGRFFPLAIRGLRGRRRLKCILTVKRGITLKKYRLLLRRHFTETQRRALAELPYTSNGFSTSAGSIATPICAPILATTEALSKQISLYVMATNPRSEEHTSELQ